MAAKLQDSSQSNISNGDLDIDTLDVNADVTNSTSEEIRVEEFKISGNELVAKVKELIHEGNTRRIILKNDEGNTLLEIPLTIGVVGSVVGVAMFPVVAALGAIGALVAHLTIVIEKQV